MSLEKSISELHDDLKNQRLSAVDLAKASLATIDKTDSKITAFLRTHQEDALAKAAEVDEKIKRGDDIAPLAGIPYALKDNISYKGYKATCSSKFLENHVALYDATVSSKLKTNDAVLVGQLNMDEFAMGSSTENSAFFPTRNPWDTDYVPGGSSGGSASSVAAGQVLFSLGSDTGGSIRQPAAFTNLVGVKPSYGTVSRYGLIAFGSSLDQIGPFTRSIEDAAYVLDAISGHDPKESTSSNRPDPAYVKHLNADLKGKKIGLPTSLMTNDFSEPVRKSVEEAVEVFKSLGATVEPVDMRTFETAISTYYLVAPSEVSSNLSRFDGVRFTSRSKEVHSLREMYMKSRGEGFGSEVQRRIILGTFALSAGSYDAYFLKSLKMRTLVVKEFNEVFSKYDLLLSPTTPSAPFKIGEVSDPMTMYLNDLATIPANIGGIPALSLPCGFLNGLPLGLQIMAKRFDDQSMLNAGYAYQQVTDFHKQRPTMVGAAS